MARMTHVDRAGRARMVDVSEKKKTRRRAVARGRGELGREAFDRLRENRLDKGDALSVARLAGIQAAKRTSGLIPLCHPLRISNIQVKARLVAVGVTVTGTVSCIDRTGVEMEALHACSVSALTIYDMCKSLDRGMTIAELQLWEKAGGRSGTWRRPLASDEELGL